MCVCAADIDIPCAAVAEASVFKVVKGKKESKGRRRDRNRETDSRHKENIY